MLESLVSVVNLFKATLYFGFYLSYKAGYFLVSSINTIFKYSAVTLDNFKSFFSAISESLVIFIQDNFQILQQILLCLTTAVEIISSSVVTVSLKIYLFIWSIAAVASSICNGFVNGLATIIASMGQLIAFVKILAILFGSGVWFVITLIPFLLYGLCSLCISFTHTIYQEICDICYSGLVNVKALIFFIFDIPLESIAGLVIAFSLAYILSQFYILIISYFTQKVRKFNMWIRQHWSGTEIFYDYFNPGQATRPEPIQRPRARQPIRERVRQPIEARSPVLTRRRARELEEKTTLLQEKAMLLESQLCVICQERNKCVLLLPCKHLCLCSECSSELRFYNELCPICRTNIESTMKIFV